jgi:anti-anti-sigma regulatory factor
MDQRDDVAWVMVNHLADILAGRCSITLAQVESYSDRPQLAEVLAGLMYLHEELQAREQARDKAMGELREALEHMQRQHEELLQSRALNDELSTPVMKVGSGIIMMPLIGSLDPLRASTILERLLEAVKSERARSVILDITGVSKLTSATAHYFIRFATAIQFLGARLVLAGIAPPVAQELAATPDIDMSLLRHSFRDVQQALRFCLAGRGTSSPEPDRLLAE